MRFILSREAPGNNVELPEHVKKIVCQNPHLQSGFVRLESRTTRLVPTEGILALLDPVLYLRPAVIDLDHLRYRS